jgi:hypothetical protein
MAGVGIGLRAPLVDDLLDAPPSELRFVEVAPENYIARGGRYSADLRRVAARWPVVAHGLSMSLGGVDPFDRGYLGRLRAFLRDIGSPWHSDHLSFGVVGGVALHELCPIPFTRAAAEHVAARVREAQDLLGLPMAVENITYYATPGAEMDEGDFIGEVLRSSGCKLLLDVNNVYVNAKNHGFDALSVLSKLPLAEVVQIHIAGHDASDPELTIDTHAEAISDDVYSLLEWTLARTGPLPVLLERDDDFPPWSELCDEVRRLDGIVQRAGSLENGDERAVESSSMRDGAACRP